MCTIISSRCFGLMGSGRIFGSSSCSWHSHDLRPSDQGGEEPIEFFEVHRLTAPASLQEAPKALKFSVGQRLGLGEGFHGCCSASHARRRGSQRFTFRQYSSYSAPNFLRSVGSS